MPFSHPLLSLPIDMNLFKGIREHFYYLKVFDTWIKYPKYFGYLHKRTQYLSDIILDTNNNVYKSRYNVSKITLDELGKAYLFDGTLKELDTLVTLIKNSKSTVLENNPTNILSSLC